jgi:hypothetical protein
LVVGLSGVQVDAESLGLCDVRRTTEVVVGDCVGRVGSEACGDPGVESADVASGGEGGVDGFGAGGREVGGREVGADAGLDRGGRDLIDTSSAAPRIITIGLCVCEFTNPGTTSNPAPSITSGSSDAAMSPATAGSWEVARVGVIAVIRPSST